MKIIIDNYYIFLPSNGYECYLSNKVVIVREIISRGLMYPYLITDGVNSESAMKSELIPASKLARKLYGIK